jgi:hypothetical protein
LDLGGWAEVRAAAVPARAACGAPPADRIGVVADAAVLSGLPGQRVTDAELAAAEVEVVPAEGERLTLSKSE